MKKRTNSQTVFLLTVAILATVAGAFLRILTSDGLESSAKQSSDDQAALEPQLSSRILVAKQPRQSVFQEKLKKERHFATMDPSEFPALMENELETAKDVGTIFELARRWTKTDPEGYLEWLQKQKGRFIRRDHGYGIGLAEALLRDIAEDDPKRAWKLAGELPGSFRDSRQFGVLTQALEENPAMAKEIIRENRIDLSLDRNSWWGDDPMDALPLLQELLPGQGRQWLIYKSISKYAEMSHNAEGLAASKKWFDQLNPELQSLVLREAKGKPFLMGSPEKLVAAWTETGEEPSKQK